MMRDIPVHVAEVVEKRGFRKGTSLENSAILLLSQVFKPNELVQQYRIERYRLDIAFPDVKIAIEVDGWYHYKPDSALRDVIRDSELRSLGWIVFRVDDREGLIGLEKQVCQVSRLVNIMRKSDWYCDV